MSTIKILVAGDIHMGRSSSRVPDDHEGDLGAKEAWHRIVEVACHDSVDLVCLTGDVVDNSNMWGALGPLETGIQKLKEHGIMVLAVSGNHDYKSLPRLAKQVSSEEFKLLGEDGTWERYTYTKEGCPPLHIDGWSFPSSHHEACPVETYPQDQNTSGATLCLVHGDFNLSKSKYAPMPKEQLAGKGVDAWLMGHIHQFQHHEFENTCVIYPGSPQALDFGEKGAHGCVMLTVEGGEIQLTQKQISSVRYEEMDIDISECRSEDTANTEVRKKIKTKVVEIGAESGTALKNLVLRLKIKGTSEKPNELKEWLHDVNEFVDKSGSVRCTIDEISFDDVELKADLKALASESSPLGLLAQTVLELRQVVNYHESTLSSSTKKLVEKVRSEINDRRRIPHYEELATEHKEEVSDAVAVKKTQQLAEELLQELHRQVQKS